MQGVFRHWTRVGDLGGGPCGAEEFSKLDPRYQASVGGIERNPRPVTVASFTDGNDEGQAEFKALRIASRLGS